MKKSFFFVIVSIALSVSLTAHAATIPFNDMVTPEIKVPEIKTPQLNVQNLERKAYLISTKRFTNVMRYSITGENPNEIGLSFNDIMVRQQFIQFEKDLTWLKTNSPEVYSPDHYPASFMRYQVNLFLSKLDDFQSQISQATKENSDKQQFTLDLNNLIGKHKMMMREYEMLANEILKAKAQRKKLEPYFSI
ncbi:MAG: hypothetical protein CMF61_05155 [Magnetococcales bacterium]|nr:hypothetical protein [Magnetococcales bacterium]